MGNTDHVFFGGGFMWLIWLLIIVGVFFIAKAMMKGSGSNASDNESPMDVLKKRYASGDIDEAEFKRRRKELES